MELLPKLTAEAPELEPYLLAAAVFFQLETNTPVRGQFLRSLDDCVDHPEKLIDPARYWGVVEAAVCQWGYYNEDYDLVVHVLEGERQAFAKRKEKFDDENKIILAYAYRAMDRWREALDIFESFPDSAVSPRISGPWGTSALLIEPDKMADLCRAKLGLKDKRDPRESDLGSVFLEIRAPFMFTTTAEGFWLLAERRLYSLDFNFKTNLVVNPPPHPGIESLNCTCLCASPDKVWLGSDVGGVTEFDKASRQFRRLTEADGLAKNEITSLHLIGDALWIGYGGKSGGALGRMNLGDGKITSFMSSISSGGARFASKGRIHMHRVGARR